LARDDASASLNSCSRLGEPNRFDRGGGG
jgi:hypothetical protein